MNRFAIVFFILSFFFSVNVFAGPVEFLRKMGGIFGSKGRKANVENLEETLPVVSLDDSLGDKVLDEVKFILRTSDREIAEDATQKEVFESFGDLFLETDKGSINYNLYRDAIFGEWWKLRDFRAVMFPLLTKEDISNPVSPVYLLQWWSEAKTMGAWRKLQDYTLSSFGEPWMEEVSDDTIDTIKAFLNNPGLELNEGQWKIIHGLDRIEDDPFIQTALMAMRTSDDFARDWRLVMDPPRHPAYVGSDGGLPFQDDSRTPGIGETNG